MANSTERLNGHLRDIRPGAGIARVVVCAVLAGAPGVATAQGGNQWFESRIQIAIAGFFPNIDSYIESPTTGKLSFEDVLGLDDSVAVPAVWAQWRINPKHRLDLSYLEINRDNRQALDTAITLPPPPGNTIPASATLNALLDVSLFRFNYTYNFINDGKKELGATVGLYYATAKYGLDGAVSAGGAALAGSEVGTLAAPMPNIGISGSYAFNSKVAVWGRFVGFPVPLSDWSGHIVELDAGVQYQAVKWLAVGAGLKYFDFELKKKSTGIGVGIDYWGPSVFGMFTF